MLRRKKILINENEEDPIAGTSNLADAMLVLAVGFLIFVTISWNMQNIIFSDMTNEERQNTLEVNNKVRELEINKELNSSSNIIYGSKNEYEELGTVYKDPETGELVMVES
ncbi:MAG: DUF2149 domain-containing protein [Methanomicrobiales archaeon]